MSSPSRHYLAGLLVGLGLGVLLVALLAADGAIPSEASGGWKLIKILGLALIVVGGSSMVSITRSRQGPESNS